MKNLKLLIVLFFLNSLLVHAQPNPFFPMKDAVWEEAYYGFAGGPFPTYTVTCGDTTINNEVYAKLYDLTLDSTGNIVDRLYRGASKTGADQVHFINTGTSASYLLYDFSLETGQSIELETIFGLNTLTVIGNNLMTDNASITRRVIIFDSGEIWIEGIGSNKGVLTRGLGLVADYDPFMNCFKYEDILVWSNETTMPNCEFSFTELCGTTSSEHLLFLEKINFKVFPNPIQSEAMIEIEGFEKLEQPEIRIFNLQGQLIQKILELNEEKISFFRKDLNAGIYVFELFDTKTTFALRKKIVIL